jgi:hypothetical protein
VPFSQQPKVQLQDESGNPVALAGVDVSAQILTGGGTLGGTAVATTIADGSATFSNLSITGTIGTRTLLFGAAGYTTVTSNGINITWPPRCRVGQPSSGTADLFGASSGRTPAAMWSLPETWSSHLLGGARLAGDRNTVPA